MKLKNSQTSIKRSHLGQRKSGLIRQVTAWAGLTLHAHQAKHFQFNVIHCILQAKCTVCTPKF